MALTAHGKFQVTCPELKFISESPFHADSNFDDLNIHFEERSLESLLHWSLATFGEKLVQITSFGPTGMVILDHLAQLTPGARIITLDTDFLFPETHALIEKVLCRYPIQLEIHHPSLTPQEQADSLGEELWKKSPDQCCYIRKVLPLQQALEPYDAWMSGIRRDQSLTRANAPFFEWDIDHHMVKINPLANWTRAQVWKYIMTHDIPYNDLHNQGYASVGCTHCTRPTNELSDERSGRWQGQNKTECGIHVSGITTDISLDSLKK